MSFSGPSPGFHPPGVSPRNLKQPNEFGVKLATRERSIAHTKSVLCPDVYKRSGKRSLEPGFQTGTSDSFRGQEDLSKKLLSRTAGDFSVIKYFLKISLDQLLTSGDRARIISQGPRLPSLVFFYYLAMRAQAVPELQHKSLTD